MARLLGDQTAQDINKDRVGSASQFAQKYGCIVVLKGSHTVIANPIGDVAISPTGNPGMATGGMGDALTGMIGGLLAQGLVPWEAAQAGVFLHGIAGDIAANQIGEIGLIAGDLIDQIPRAFQHILSPSER